MDFEGFRRMSIDFAEVQRISLDFEGFRRISKDWTSNLVSKGGFGPPIWGPRKALALQFGFPGKLRASKLVIFPIWGVFWVRFGGPGGSFWSTPNLENSGFRMGGIAKIRFFEVLRRGGFSKAMELNGTYPNPLGGATRKLS